MVLLPTEPVEPYAVEHAGRSGGEKRAEVAETLRKDKIDAAILSAPDSIAWLLNVRGNDVPFTPLPLSFAIVHSDGAVEWFVDEKKRTPGLAAHLGNDVAIAAPADFGPALDAVTEGNKDTRILLRADKAVDYGSVMDVMNLLRGAGYAKIALVGLEGAPAQ